MNNIITIMETHKHTWVLVGKDTGSGDDNAYCYKCSGCGDDKH